MIETLLGGCFCGSIRIAMQGPPYRVGICHCLDCRRKSGSLFSAFAIYPVAALSVTGETASHALRHGDVQHFCPRCASPLYQLQDGSDEVGVFLGTLDEPNRLAPSYELWTVRREAWMPEFPLARHYAYDREGKGRSEP
jgi:hypothetical protein